MSVQRFDSMEAKNYAEIMGWVMRPDSGVLYRNKRTGQYAFGQLIRHDRDLRREGFKRLSLREITVWGYRLNKVPNAFGLRARDVATSLNMMAGKKLENLKRRSAFLRCILIVIDVIRNFFAGHGLKTTAKMASDLSAILENAPPQSKHRVAKEKERVRKRGKGKRADRKTPVMTRHSRTLVSRKFQAVNNYAALCGINRDRTHDKGPAFHSIWTDIVSIEPQDNGPDSDPTTSVVGLMQQCSRLQQVDLRNEKCIGVAIDVYIHCKKEVSNQLTEWLMKQDTFNALMMKEIFRLFQQKAREEQSFEWYPLMQLVKLYQEKSWHQTAELGLNDPLIVDTITTLLKMTSQMESEAMKNITAWMIRQDGFELVSLVRWLQVFREKEREPSKVDHQMAYPVRDFFIAVILENEEWKNKVQVHVIIHYLKECEAWSKK